MKVGEAGAEADEDLICGVALIQEIIVESDFAVESGICAYACASVVGPCVGVSHAELHDGEYPVEHRDVDA